MKPKLFNHNIKKTLYIYTFLFILFSIWYILIYKKNEIKNLNEKYEKILLQNYEYWNFGWRIEELFYGLKVQNEYISSLEEDSIRLSNMKSNNEIFNYKWDENLMILKNKNIKNNLNLNLKNGFFGQIVRLKCHNNYISYDPNATIYARVGRSDFPYGINKQENCKLFSYYNCSNLLLKEPNFMFRIIRFDLDNNEENELKNELNNEQNDLINDDIKLNGLNELKELENELNLNQNNNNKNINIIDNINGDENNKIIFGLKSLSSNLLLKVNPPPRDQTSNEWSISTTSILPEAGTRFYIDSNTGILYSIMMRSPLICVGDNVKDKIQPILGWPDIDLPYKDTLSLEPVNKDDIEYANKLLFYSYQYETMTKTLYNNNNNNKIKKQDLSDIKNNIYIKGNEKIAILIPITSKDTKVSILSDSPFFNIVLDSFLESIDWNKNNFYIGFFLGSDENDIIYGQKNTPNDIRAIFYNMIRNKLESLGYDNNIIDKTCNLLDLRIPIIKNKIGQISRIVNDLTKKALKDNYEYFYHIKDDTRILSSNNWLYLFIEKLKSSKIYPGLGVVGPKDLSNSDILTHPFIHKTHLDIFNGKFYPDKFKNWYSDNWISLIYGTSYTHQLPNINIFHDQTAQKKNGIITRYNIDYDAQLFLEEEVKRGWFKINEWIENHKYINEYLPIEPVCRYYPLSRDIYSLKLNEDNNEL